MARAGQPSFGLATEESWHTRTAARALPARDFLAVTVGDEEYGIDILRIREIIKVRAGTEVPRAPRFVLGVISVRGVIVPVIDLRERLHLRADEAPRAPRILIVTRDEELLGLLVDSVRHVVRFTEESIEPPPPMLSGAEADFVSGIGRVYGRMVILLNLDAILRFEVSGRRRDEEGAR